ncbi:MAG: hypothetical protein ABWK00_03420 [Desulfurococcaceae archaeon]
MSELGPILKVKERVNRERFRIHLMKHNPFDPAIPDEERRKRHMMVWRDYAKETIEICNYAASKLREIADFLDRNPLELAFSAPEEFKWWRNQAIKKARASFHYITVMYREGCIERPKGPTVIARVHLVPQPVRDVAEGDISKAPIAAGSLRDIVNMWVNAQKDWYEVIEFTSKGSPP